MMKRACPLHEVFFSYSVLVWSPTKVKKLHLHETNDHKVHSQSSNQCERAKYLKFHIGIDTQLVLSINGKFLFQIINYLHT